MDFTVTQSFGAAADDVARAYASAELYGHMVGMPKLSTPEVLDRRVDGDVVELDVRFRFVGDLSAAVTAVVDPRKLSWVEHSTHDLAARTVAYRLAPDHYEDRLRSSGTCATRPEGDGAVRTLSGSLSVRARLVGGAVERAIVSGLREHLAHEVAVVDYYLASTR